MADWSVSMAGEGEGGYKLWDEGEHTLIVKDVELVASSNSGNPYFLWTFENEEGDKIEVRTTLIKGKRWLLKQLLSACGIEAMQDDPEEKYRFNPNAVIDKKVLGTIKNKENKYTNREGKEIVNTKSEIQRFQKINKADPDSLPF